jgi:hypothetical protein
VPKQAEYRHAQPDGRRMAVSVEMQLGIVSAV